MNDFHGRVRVHHSAAVVSPKIGDSSAGAKYCLLALVQYVSEPNARRRRTPVETHHGAAATVVSAIRENYRSGLGIQVRPAVGDVFVRRHQLPTDTVRESQARVDSPGVFGEEA